MQILRRLKWRLLNRDPKLSQLQKKLGYFFANRDLLIQSVTHKSVHSDPAKNYEQLEFLGDAIIDYVISEKLISEFPESSEGLLTKKRSELVKQSFLATMGKRLEFLEYIEVMPSVDLSHNKVSQNQLANVFEAIIGGMYLDGGIKPCERVIVSTVWKNRREAWQNINHKGVLIEYCQANQLDPPRFIVTRTSGPEHEKVFEVTVQLADERSPAGRGETKKAAEQEAAQITLDLLRS